MTTGSRSTSGTPTPSLRRRVVLFSLAVLAILLTLLGVVLDLTLGAQVNRDLRDRLLAEGSRADALVAAGTAPAQLVAQLGGGTVRALLVTRSGQTFGDPAIDPLTRTGPFEPLPLPPPPRHPRSTERPVARRHPRRTARRRWWCTRWPTAVGSFWSRTPPRPSRCDVTCGN
jgi:hypothetical protein